MQTITCPGSLSGKALGGKAFPMTIHVHGSPVIREKGIDINRIAALGSRLMELRSQRKKKQKWTIDIFMLDVLCELAVLGASLDEEGWVRTEG